MLELQHCRIAAATAKSGGCLVPKPRNLITATTITTTAISSRALQAALRSPLSAIPGSTASSALAAAAAAAMFSVTRMRLPSSYSQSKQNHHQQRSYILAPEKKQQHIQRRTFTSGTTRPANQSTTATIGSSSSSKTTSSGGSGNNSNNRHLPLGSPIANVSSLDHLVLTVKSLEASIKWYTSVLGMRHVMFDTDAPSSSPSSSTPPHPVSSSSTSPDHRRRRRRHALQFTSQRINLHEAGRGFEPKAASPGPGSADLCFIVREDVAGLPARLEAAGVQVIWHDAAASSSPSSSPPAGSEAGTGASAGKTAVVTRTGARGTLRSVYLRDPDGNLIELSNYKSSRSEDATEGNEDEYEENVKADAEHEEEGVVPTPS